MITFLHGILHSKQEGFCVINVSGIGYEVEISSITLRQLPENGKEIKLLIYHHFTDSDQRLFGFSSQKEKNLFEKLITVKGIGPKLGLTILSGMPAANLIEAIITQNVGSLSSISGIGKKTAERMVLELKDKILDEGGASVVTDGGEQAGKREEAISAMVALGFKKRDAEQTVDGILQKDPKKVVSGIVKQALADLKR